MARLHISLLGSYKILLDGKSIRGFDSDKTRLLLAYLVVEAHTPHRREQLIGLFWPEQSEASAHHNLSQALYNLRHLLGERGRTGALRDAAEAQASGQFLFIDAYTVQFNPRSDHILDTRRFSELVADCQRHAHRYLEACPECMKRLENAEALYRGDFLAELSLKDCVLLEEWAMAQRERLSRQVIEVLGHLAQCYAGCGELQAALQATQRQVQLDPLWEAGQRQLMHLLALNGQRSAALDQYEACRHLLAKELGIEPEKETVALAEQIRQEALPGSLVGRLPAPTGLFIGRQEEQLELQGYLRDPSCRLLSVVGAGGCGKTHLVLEVARRLAPDFPDGVYYISLSAYQPGNPLWPLLVEALRIPMRDHQDPERQVLDYLGDKKALLIFDSFETALEQAAWLSDLLQRAPHLTALVTSRAHLQISAEQIFPLGGMNVPAPDETDIAEQFEAVQLFLSFARRRRPDFTLDEHTRSGVARLCRAVQGLPLGLLLASAWVELYSPQEIAGQIERSLDFLEVTWSDVPARQCSLRATFDYSWNQLSAAEQDILTALAVFHGSFSLQEAGEITQAPARTLQSLVDKSMVSRTPEGRYQLHDLLRQFAAQRLEREPERFEEIYSRHSCFYLQALADWEVDLKSARQREALEAIDHEAENLRLAWRWAVLTRDWQGITAGLEGMVWYVDLRFRFEEGERACRTAVEALVEADEDIRLQLRLLTWQSRFLNQLGQREAAQQLLEQGLSMQERGQDQGLDLRRERANLSFERAEMAYYSDRTAASCYYRDSLALYQELQDEWQAGAALMALGELVHHSGNFTEARRLLSQALEYQLKVGEPSRMARTLRWLAFTEARLGQIGQAEQTLRESVELRRISGNRLDAALANDDLGTMISWSGKYSEGTALLEQSLAVYHEMGYRSKEIWAHGILGLQNLMQGMYQKAKTHVKSCLKLALASESRREIALGHCLLGMVALGENCYSAAFDLLQESVCLYRQIDQKDELGWALINQAFVARALGRANEAQVDLYEAAQLVMAVHGFSTVSFFIPAAALFVADQGDIERAVELYALASRFPNVSQARWFEDVAGLEIDVAAANLPPEVVAAARQRGQARDLFATAAELEEEMRERMGAVATGL